MDYTLEVVPVPVSDIDDALVFYRDRMGFHLDHDVAPHPGQRFVQLTPPGSACSIVLGATPSAPGSLQGLQLVVDDIDQARAELLARGAEVGDPVSFGGGSLDRPPVRYLFLHDLDGNGWAIQERIPA